MPEQKYADVLVVTCTDLGWDCVVGVYIDEDTAHANLDGDGEFETLDEWLAEYDTYIVHNKSVELK